MIRTARNWKMKLGLGSVPAGPSRSSLTYIRANSSPSLPSSPRFLQRPTDASTTWPISTSRSEPPHLSVTMAALSAHHRSSSTTSLSSSRSRRSQYHPASSSSVSHSKQRGLESAGLGFTAMAPTRKHILSHVPFSSQFFRFLIPIIFSQGATAQN
jgi:hypothetical protein